MLFKNLSLSSWRQFRKVDIDLNDRLTILTGANGSGKTTILNIFSSHFGWDFRLLATPTLTGRELQYSVGFHEPPSEPLRAQQHARYGPPIGSLTYSDGQIASLAVYSYQKAEFLVKVEPIQPVSGIHVTSHRPTTAYRILQSIPTAVMRPEEAYAEYVLELRRHHSGHPHSRTPSEALKALIISMGALAGGNEFSPRNEEVAQAFQGFIDVLHKILPNSLRFRKIEIRTPEVVLVTDSGEFIMDAASGGIMTLIDLAWQIHMYSIGKEQFVVSIDEPENHLHPSMQRSILGDLLSAFPQVQFIVATHSPFIVSSVEESTVYVLRYEDDTNTSAADATGRYIYSEKLDQINKAGTANEVLRSVLGVPVTIAPWIERRLNDLVEKYLHEEFTSDTLNHLRSEITTLGFGELYPETLAQLVSRRNDQTN